VSRKPRIEYPGAIYHVISRGNYRKDLFKVGESGKAFEKALYEACERCSWRLHAYVIMSNHYHLAVETPDGNLVEGLKWLQGTFAVRFNRFTGERGHVFQGRYKALLVEAGRSLLGLVNYIHLNPVRAKICTIEQLKGYELSSYKHYSRRKFSEFLDRKTFLSLSGLPDTLSGMRRYKESLALQDEADSGKRIELYAKYIQGWLIGSKDFKKQQQKEFETKPISKDWGGPELQEMSEVKWERIARRELKKYQKNKSDIARDKKSEIWKIQIAKILRRESTATNPWIARRLNMGHPTRVSSLVTQKLKF